MKLYSKNFHTLHFNYINILNEECDKLMEQLDFSALEQPLFLLALQLVAFVLIIYIVYGILHNTILKLNSLNGLPMR